MRVLLSLLTAVIVTVFFVPPALAGDVGPWLKSLQAVGPKGAGHREAGRAWGQLARAEAEQLPAILAGLDDAAPLAANWIRAAVDTIAERQLARGGKLPAAELERFVLDRRHAPRARRLAYEWLCRVDASAPGRLVPGMLDDPSLEMRRDAVTRRIEEADVLQGAGKDDQAAAVCREALAAARDPDQIQRLADRLKKLGAPPDLPRHFGFLVRWQVIGPLENTDEKGFDAVYPPEEEINLQASYEGKHGKVQWIDHATKDEYGQVDLNKVLGEEKSVVGYAITHFVSEREQTAEIRSTSENALKLWLNGRLIFARNVYHTGSQLDQFVSPVLLRPGRNVILVKVCQNAIMESWGRSWRFQLRVCDRHGTAILSADRDQ